MISKRFLAYRAAALTVLGAAFVYAPTPARALDASEMTTDAAVRCKCPARLSQFNGRLVRVGRQLSRGAPLTIVALGSSSTAGAMASNPDKSYPSRLAAELRSKFPRNAIRVINRGLNGDTISGMLARMDRDVFAEKPDLVIWQLGTNSVLRDESLKPTVAMVRDGLSRIHGNGADTILIDPQFAPRVNEKPEARRMVSLISSLASDSHTPLFPRFEIMRNWHDEGRPFSAFLAEDNLHLNDWSYGCMARLLATMIAGAVSSEDLLRQHAILESYGEPKRQ